SKLGSIGSPTEPLAIQTHGVELANGGLRDGTITARALGDVALTQVADHLLIRGIVSDAGDVYLNVPGGSVYDAATSLSLAPTLAEAQAAWQRLGLNDPDFGQVGVAAFENSVGESYRQFWQLLANGSVQDGAYTLNASAASSYGPQAAAALGAPDPTVEQVRAYAADRYSQLVAFFEANLAADWMSESEFQVFDPGFNYVATPEQVADLTLHTSWTADQLLYALDQAALQPAVSIPLQAQQPHVSGRAVSITAGGEVGRVRPPQVISLAAIQSGALTPAEKLALATARVAGEAVFVGTDAQGNTVTFPDGESPPGVTATGVQVTIHRPLLVAVTNSPEAALNVTAPDGITIWQTAGDLVIGAIASDGAVELAAPGSIVNAQTVVHGFGGDGTGWTANLTGDSSTVIADDVLTLTDNRTNQARSAWLNTPVSTSGFTASFTYQAGGDRAADGAALVWQNQGPQALGGIGGSLGLGGIRGSTAAYEINLFDGHVQGTNFVQSSALSISAGSTSDIELFLADTHVSGGLVSRTTAPIDTTQVANPAPQEVYQSTRYGNFTYTLADLTPNATYTVRLLFAETFWSAANARLFDVVINGTRVLDSFDVFAQAGGKDVAIERAFDTQADSAGQITAQFVTVADNSIVSGIEIVPVTTGNYLGTDPVDVTSGNPIRVTLRYDEQASALVETLTDTTTGATFTRTYANVDLGNLLGPAAFIGFTGATGGAISTQTIRDFELFFSYGGIDAADITLRSTAGGIGAVDAPLTVILGDGRFNATAESDILVHQSVGNLNVGQVTSVQGDILLDPPEPGQSVVLFSDSVVTAPLGHVTFQAHDDVSLAAGSKVHALTVTVQAGFSVIPGASADSRVTLAGLIDAGSVLILGGSGKDSVWIGSDGIQPGTLDLIRGHIEFRGAGGGDELTLDDRAAMNGGGLPLRTGYAITPNQVGNNPGLGTAPRMFAGLTYDDSVSRLGLLGSAGSSMFHVTPSQDTEFHLAGHPDAGAGLLGGNSLTVDETGTLGAARQHSSSAAGSWTFAEPHRPVQFGGIARFNRVTFGAWAGTTIIHDSTADDATFVVTYRGLTAIGLEGGVGEHDAVRVVGPNGYHELARFVQVTPSWDGSSQVVTYRVPAPSGQWRAGDNGAYSIEVLPGRIGNGLGQLLPAAQVGTLWVNIDRLWLTSTLQEPGTYRLEVAGASPGATVVFVRGTQAGQFPLDPLGLTLDLADPVELGQVVADTSGQARLVVQVPPQVADELLGFQAFEQAPAPLGSHLVHAAAMSRLIESIETAGGVVTGGQSVQFRVTFTQPVAGVTADGFHLVTSHNVANARIAHVAGLGSEYLVTVETGSGDGTLRLRLTDEAEIANATGVGANLTRSGGLAGSSFTIHKTREDVNLDFVISPVDALVLINAINRNQGGYRVSGGDADPWWHDVNQDGWVSPVDVLIVFNYLNWRAGLAAGEGEDIVPTNADAPVVDLRDYLAEPVERNAASGFVQRSGAASRWMDHLPSGPRVTQETVDWGYDPSPPEVRGDDLSDLFGESFEDVAADILRAWRSR
ncbi:MAG: hypothetical protein J5I93_01060, partial [Pirellulaceae bacterium]|nr:hypothetical protein [Pirellulaceae bacterium]